MRFPLYLTLILALFALLSTLKMEEHRISDPIPEKSPEPTQNAEQKIGNTEQKPERSSGQQTSTGETGFGKIKNAFLLTFRAGGWILKTPFVLSVILFGMLFDGLIRMVITLSSQYYRLVELPESIFGIIGAGVSMLGLIVPRIAGKIAESGRPSRGLWVTSVLALTGLWGMTFFQPYWGLVPALITFSAMYFTGFLVSFHVNRVTSSEQRATVLSFKGLLYNISYGVLGVFYALLLKVRKARLMTAEVAGKTAVTDGVMDMERMENAVFMDSFGWFALALPAGLILLLLVYRLWLKKDGKEGKHLA